MSCLVWCDVIKWVTKADVDRFVSIYLLAIVTKLSRISMPQVATLMDPFSFFLSERILGEGDTI